ncbi:Uncharacterized protein Rs2_45500 [Raphanus sativus]|nr:Uncharacterized protein Rs2_45500 [Raphanus sativus]
MFQCLLREGGSYQLSSFDVTKSNQYSQRARKSRQAQARLLRGLSPAIASKNSKAKASLSSHVFFDDVVPEICIDTLYPMWCITTAIFLEGFARVQNLSQRWLMLVV